MDQSFGIHWFRRDLRVAGNRGLSKNWKRNKGRVVGLFCFDKKFLGREDFSVHRFQFFMETLKELQSELREMGSDLFFIDVGPEVGFDKILKDLPNPPSLITWGQDYEPYARARDKKMQDFFKSKNIETFVARDHLLIEPHELGKKDRPDETYQVYSPFARRWLDLFQDDSIQKRVQQERAGIEYLKSRLNKKCEIRFNLTWADLLPDFPDPTKVLQSYLIENRKRVKINLPKAGSLQAFQELQSFTKRLDHYQSKRDIPSVKGTSGFSIFLKNGSLTIPQIIYYLKLQAYKKKSSSQDSFFSELIWREFYYHILYHHPHVETQSFLSQYENLRWENNNTWFEAWKSGQTGFPIVDAGMRQLQETGWMHNRVRMIVASFLTKDLLIDWRWGEKYFMETLLDGDLAPNNGGWQWAASTGCDPQPYFRIFNPWSQSSKFDPKGEYIKSYLPELADLSPKELHAPVLGNKNYPEPIVDHKEQRLKALEIYKATRKS